MSGLFQNGNRRITKLVLWKLGVGIAVMVITQIQGFLPTLDFLPPRHLKWISFVLAVLLSSTRGVEMFFDQTLQLFNGHDDEPPGAPVILPAEPLAPPTTGSALPPGHVP